MAVKRTEPWILSLAKWRSDGDFNGGVMFPKLITLSRALVPLMVVFSLVFHERTKPDHRVSADQYREINGIELLTEIEMDGEIVELEWSPDGQMLAVNILNTQERWSAIQFFAFNNDALEQLQVQIDNSGLVKFSDDSRVVSISQATLQIWDVVDGQLIQSIQLDGKQAESRWITYGYDLNADGSLFAAIDEYPTVEVWNVADGRKIQTFDGRAAGMNIGHQAVREGLAFSPINDSIAFADDRTETIYFWDMIHPPQAFIGNSDNIHELQFDHSGTMLALSGWNYGFRLVNAQTFREIAFFETRSTFASATTEMEFSPNNHILVGGDRDGQLEFWDIERELLLLSIQAHLDIIWALDIHPTDWVVASGDYGGTLRLWRVHSD